jgi:predicted GNAT family acetyltransferase
MVDRLGTEFAQQLAVLLEVEILHHVERIVRRGGICRRVGAGRGRDRFDRGLEGRNGLANLGGGHRNRQPVDDRPQGGQARVVERQGAVEAFLQLRAHCLQRFEELRLGAGKLGELAQQAVRRDQTFVAPALRKHGLGSKAVERVLKGGKRFQGDGHVRGNNGSLLNSAHFRNTLCQID